MYIMKKTLLFLTLLVVSATLFAQEEVTKFLGIPVDGSKSEMIRKLKAKGYASSPLDKDILVGKFNGEDVRVLVVTNGDKVYRIAIVDDNSRSEIDIKIRFNNLCQQFNNNKKYLSFSNGTLSDDEKISFGITVEKKRYETSYMQLPSVVDTIDIQNKIVNSLLKKYTEDELSNPTEELRDEIIEAVVSIMVEKNSKRSVWFMINEDYGKYYITMYYDNLYNMANGEDL